MCRGLPGAALLLNTYPNQEKILRERGLWDHCAAWRWRSVPPVRSVPALVLYAVFLILPDPVGEEHHLRGTSRILTFVVVVSATSVFRRLLGLHSIFVAMVPLPSIVDFLELNWICHHLMIVGGLSSGVPEILDTWL